MGRHNETVIADADGRQVAAWLLDEHAEAIVAARNATHREPERMVPGREPACRSCAKPMNPTPPGMTRSQTYARRAWRRTNHRRNPGFGVQTIGGGDDVVRDRREALAA